MKKLIYLFLLVCIAILPANAKYINKVVKDSNLGIKSTLSIYVLNSDSNKEIYKKNEEKLLNPASVLKTLTFGVSYKVLGENFQFLTKVYKHNNDLYLKLSGDTLLSSKDLADLFSQVKTKYDTTKINNIYIDDSIFNKYYPYPSGWTQDDLWPYSRPITPYIIDNNTTEIAIKRSSLATTIDIVQNNEYKIPIINMLTLSSKDKEKEPLKIERMYSNESSIVKFSGTIEKDTIFNLPVVNPEINFDIKLRKALDKNSIAFDKKITSKQTPKEAILLAQVGHSIEEISKDILHNSDNFSAEVVFRTAAAKHINYIHSATVQDSIDMFYQINSKYTNENLKIVDGSGVSRYNLIDAKTAVEIFNKLSKETKLTSLLASADEGTLKDRMSFLKGNLKAKTGTLRDMSAIIGTLKTKKNKNVVFCSIVQNSPKRKAILKNFENDLITEIYRKY